MLDFCMKEVSLKELKIDIMGMELAAKNEIISRKDAEIEMLRTTFTHLGINFTRPRPKSGSFFFAIPKCECIRCVSSPYIISYFLVSSSSFWAPLAVAASLSEGLQPPSVQAGFGLSDRLQPYLATKIIHWHNPAKFFILQNNHITT